MPAKPRVAVIMGGRSSEHEISRASAASVLETLEAEGYETVTVEIGRDGRWALGTGRSAIESNSLSLASRNAGEGEREASNRLSLGQEGPSETLPVPADGAVPAALASVDVVLPILHGPFGEDGTVQGLLELADVPYVGPGVAASALCMDKDLFKKVLRDSGIPVARHHAIRRADAIENPFGYPVFVKPARLGSSVGITKVHAEEELAPAVALAREHDEKVLIEEFVAGTEVECSVLGNLDTPPIASLVGEIVANAEWYDYSAKYDEGGMDLIVPARIPEETARRVQDFSVQAFVASECEGMARADCFVREDGEVIVNELNTIPGFTATSVYAKLFEASGIPYRDLLERLIQLALERHERRSRLKY
jgi:D-alanine-D-alanine ligase